MPTISPDSDHRHAFLSCPKTVRGVNIGEGPSHCLSKLECQNWVSKVDVYVIHVCTNDPGFLWMVWMVSPPNPEVSYFSLATNGYLHRMLRRHPAYVLGRYSDPRALREPRKNERTTLEGSQFFIVSQCNSYTWKNRVKCLETRQDGVCLISCPCRPYYSNESCSILDTFCK